MQICAKGSVWNGEEFLLVRAPSVYREITRAISVDKESRSRTRRRRKSDTSGVKNIELFLLRKGWTKSKLGFLKSRVAVAVEYQRRQRPACRAFGRIAMAFARADIDVGVLVLVSSRRSMRLRASRNSDEHPEKMIPRRDIRRFMPPTPLLVLDVEE
jgi:hypothetical protein